MKPKKIFIVLISLFLLMPAGVLAADIFEGEIIGFDCFRGKVDCNSDMYRHAHVAFEPDFILKINDRRHYMLSGLPIYLKQQLAGSRVFVKGTLTNHNTTINVDEVEMIKADIRITVWSKEIKENIKKKQDWKAKFWHDREFHGN